VIRSSRAPKLKLLRSLESSNSNPQPRGFHGMSVANTNKLRARVATLEGLLDDFDGQLDDLLAESLPETLFKLETLQQAKLQVTIPYLVYDLVISGLRICGPLFGATEGTTSPIVYLKTKGIDPRTHPVFRELVRYSNRALTLPR
jgi:exosome complex protein LRP1